MAVEQLNKPATRVHVAFSAAEYHRRYQAVRQILEERRLAGVVCYGNRGATGMLDYLANFPPRWEALLYFPYEGDPVLLVQLFNHLPDAQQISVIPDTRWGGVDGILTLAEELGHRGLARGKLGLAGPLPYQRFAELQRALPYAKWEDISQALGRLRWVKSEAELQRLRQAAALTDLAMGALVNGVHPGMRECDLPALMEAAVAADGGQLELCYLASTPMENPLVYVPAQNLTNRRIQSGDVIITEIGVAAGGYAGQIHRPIAVGQPPLPAYQQLFEVALETYHRVVASIRPGSTEQDVLEAAQVVHQRGFTIYDDLVHGFGGGYLPPILRTRQTSHGEVKPFVFRENMCIVVQPNIVSHNGRSGLQLGQLHVVTGSGLEALQRYPLDFIVTNSSLSPRHTPRRQRDW